MKGLTHFMCGLAVATCFGAAMRASMVEYSSILILGGIFGYLPDFLDFKILQYLEEYDYVIDPDGDTLNPKEVTETFVKAIHKARDTGKPVSIKFHTIKLGADNWRRYSILIDTENKRIVSELGPIVTTGQAPLVGTEPPKEMAYSESFYDADVIHTYDKETYADIMRGPDFGIVPDGDKLRIDFIPWHRKWSHSFTAAFLFMPIGFLIYGFTDMGVMAAFIILFGYWAHVVGDQLGVMGSNLFPPFTTKRSQGMGLFHSGRALPNFFTNYICIALIIYNMNRFAFEPVFTTSAIRFFGLTTAIPLGMLFAISYWYEHKYVKPEKHTLEEDEAEELMSELEETSSSRNI